MLKIDSRKVLKGDTFLAIDKGHLYVEDAINNGATTVIVEKGDYKVNTIQVLDTKKYLTDYLYDNYYNDIKDIKLIGITGTNGKTTTAYLIYEVLNKLNVKCAYIGTLGFYINNEVIHTNNTTPNIYEIYEYLLKCKENNIEYVSMEVSSQGLCMGRLDTLKFSYAAFTNLTQDHLDYHKTMNNYIEAKKMLFKKLDGVAIINVDDDLSTNFMINKNIITYGKKSDQYKIDNIITTSSKTSFTLNGEQYNTKLIGEYNVYNLAIVIIILKLMNLNSKIIELLLPPKGRTQMINYNDNKIIIDYAHTPDAVLKVIQAMKQLKPKNIITIVGCGGNRDKTKRPIMGKISVDNSSYVIFTTDNPRYENKRKILKDITCKLDKNNYKIIVNRYKAIKKGIQKLSKNDILLVLGKGHEEYQEIKGKKTYFSDYDAVMNIIRR